MPVRPDPDPQNCFAEVTEKGKGNQLQKQEPSQLLVFLSKLLLLKKIYG